MAVSQITGLSELLRKTKAMVGRIPALAQELSNTADDGRTTIVAVEDLTKQFKQDFAELRAVLGALDNGGPPIEPGQ